jgi:hypothetical protein
MAEPSTPPPSSERKKRRKGALADIQKTPKTNAESATGNGSYKLSGPAYIAKLEIRENGARA